MEGAVRPTDIFMDLLISMPLSELHKTRRKIDVVITILGSPICPECLKGITEGVYHFNDYTFWVYSDFHDYKGEKNNKEQINDYLKQYHWNMYKTRGTKNKGKTKWQSEFKYYFRRHVDNAE